MAGLHGRSVLAAAAGNFAAHLIGHAPGGDLNQPGAGMVGEAGSRPLNGGGEQGFLHGVLGGSEVAEAAHDRAEHLRREIAQQVLGGCVQRLRAHSRSSGGPLMTCRTSMGIPSGTPPGPGAAEARAAIW